VLGIVLLTNTQLFFLLSDTDRDVRPVAASTIPVRLFSFLLSSLVEYLFYPYRLPIMRPCLALWRPGKPAHFSLLVSFACSRGNHSPLRACSFRPVYTFSTSRSTNKRHRRRPPSRSEIQTANGLAIPTRALSPSLPRPFSSTSGTQPGIFFQTFHFELISRPPVYVTASTSLLGFCFNFVWVHPAWKYLLCSRGSYGNTPTNRYQSASHYFLSKRHRKFSEMFVISLGDLVNFSSQFQH
jgi:hypothetical protein